MSLVESGLGNSVLLSGLRDRVGPWRTWLGQKRFGSSERMRVYRRIAKMIEGGKSDLLSSLETLREQASRDGSSPYRPAALALAEWYRRIDGGDKMSDAVTGWVPEDDALAIAAAEEGTQLSETLQRLARMIQVKSLATRALVKHLSYPAALAAGIVAFIWVVGTEVLPTYSQVLPSRYWTGAGATLAGLSEFVRGWLAVAVGGALAFIAAVVWSLPRMTGIGRLYLDSLPPFSVYSMFQGVNFLLSLATLVRAGVPERQALRRIRRRAVPYLRERVDPIIIMIGRGIAFGDALKMAAVDGEEGRYRYWFPNREAIDDLSIYSRRAGFHVGLEMVANEAMEDAEHKIGARAASAAGVFLVLEAAVILWLAFGMFDVQRQVTEAARNPSLQRMMMQGGR